MVRRMPAPRRSRAVLLALVLPLGVLACDREDPPDLRQSIGDAVRENLGEVKAKQETLEQNQAQVLETLAALGEQQTQLLVKLDSLAEAVAELELEKAAPRPAPRPTPGRPDPATTYKVTLDDAHVRGPADAKVTIVAWSDFQ